MEERRNGCYKLGMGGENAGVNLPESLHDSQLQGLGADLLRGDELLQGLLDSDNGNVGHAFALGFGVDTTSLRRCGMTRYFAPFLAGYHPSDGLVPWLKRSRMREVVGAYLLDVVGAAKYPR